MIALNWTAEFSWLFYPRFYRSSIGWGFELRWLWFQFCIYNTRAAHYLTKTTNKGVDQWRGLRDTLITRKELDAEVDATLGHKR